MRNAKVFAGSSHPELAVRICERLGVQLAQSESTKFANSETNVTINVSVREQDVFIIQSGSDEVNDSLMELLIMISALKTSSAARITAVIPYFPYSKQCKKKMHRSCISSKLVANMLRVAGVDHVITVDLHASQIQGFFDVPVDNLYAEPCLVQYLREHVPDYKEAVVVAKNAGGVKRVTSLADALQADFALLHKERSHPNGNHDEIVEKITLVGNVKNKTVFLLDDIVDACKSFVRAAEYLMQNGASCVFLIATHGILSGTSITDLENSPHIHRVIVTNTYPISEAKRRLSKKLEVIDMSGTLSEAIRRTHNGESISYLFHHAPMD